MTTDHKAVQIKHWIKAGKQLEAAIDDFTKVTLAPPEMPMQTTAWKVFEQYTETLSTLVGDEDGWLEWFWLECKFGESPMEMTFANGEHLLVAGIDDLLAAIQQNPDGTRS